MATGVGEEGPSGFRRSARRRPGASMLEAARRGSSRVLQCRGAEVHGDELRTRTWASAGAGRGPGRRRQCWRIKLQGTIAIEGEIF